MSELVLNLKKKYFDEIKAGVKTSEYRLVKPYWEKRFSKYYSHVVLKCGYPPRDRLLTTIKRKIKSITKTTITHPEFGENEVEVFEIKLGVE